MLYKVEHHVNIRIGPFTPVDSRSLSFTLRSSIYNFGSTYISEREYYYFGPCKHQNCKGMHHVNIRVGPFTPVDSRSLSFTLRSNIFNFVSSRAMLIVVFHDDERFRYGMFHFSERE